MIHRIVFLLLATTLCEGLRLRSVRGHWTSGDSRRVVILQNGKLEDVSHSEKPAVFVVKLRGSQRQTTESLTSRDEEVKVVGAYNVYKEQETNEKVVNTLTENPAFKMMGFVFNPTTLLLVTYFASIGWSQVLWLQKFLKLFGRGTLSKAKGDEGYVTPVEELPFQIFECEKCGMEMRPARGRADAIFARERFRCSRCGSKASSYFNIEDLTDPRAVARLERIKKDKEEKDAMMDGDDGNEGDEEGGGDEDEPPVPPKKGPGKRRF